MPATGPQSISWTRVLVRRATPFAALAAVFAVQALASAEPVVAFPLYLTVVLLVSLQQDRAESVAVAIVAAIALLIRPLATAGQAAEMHTLIRLELRSLFKTGAAAVRILYGGSVTPQNVDELMGSPGVDGVLVGGASLKAEEFARIASYRIAR